MAVDLSKDLVIRWDDPDPAHVPLLKQIGAAAVLLSAPHPAFSEACSAAGIATIAAANLQFTNVAGLADAKGSNVVLTNGLWPGITKPPSVPGRGDETASASREP